jgi:hypothetical protein
MHFHHHDINNTGEQTATLYDIIVKALSIVLSTVMGLYTYFSKWMIQDVQQSDLNLPTHEYGHLLPQLTELIPAIAIALCTAFSVFLFNKILTNTWDRLFVPVWDKFFNSPKKPKK